METTLLPHIYPKGSREVISQSLSVSRRVFAVFLTVGVALSLSACDNDPVSSSGTFQSGAILDALRMVDLRGDEPRIIDTVAVLFSGSSTVYAYNVRVNDEQLSLVASAVGQALYTGSVDIVPGGPLTLEVKTSRTFNSNTMQLPAVQPMLIEPAMDSVYARGPITISWSEPTSGTLSIEIAEETATGALGDSLWSAEVDASLGSVVVPDSVWNKLDEEAVALAVWNTSYHYGEGFEYGIVMVGWLGTRQRFGMQAP